MGHFPGRRAIPVISFVGHHDSGKTRLLIRLVEHFVDRGHRVGVVKHAPSYDIELPQGADSTRFPSSGALRTLLWGRNGALLHWSAFSDHDLLETLEQLFFDCDLVLIEGHKHGPFPKIEVYRRLAGTAHEPLAGEIDVIAVVSDDALSLPDGLVRFSPSDTEAIADFVESRFLLS